ncbi:MAG: M35 family metallo-endopeptidase [Thermoanaerobaculia bacterium]
MIRSLSSTLAAAALVALALGISLPAEAARRSATVELSADQNEFTTSDDVTVRFTISNDSEAPISVYIWDTPLGEIENDLFDVTRDGERVAYLGIIAKRLDPTSADFIRLRSGHSRSAVIELSALYDMSRPGFYTVQYRAGLAGVVPASGARAAEALNSNSVALRLTGEARPSPIADASSRAALATTSFVSCSATQQTTLSTQALPSARTYASNASSSLTSSSATRYQTWFGAPDTARFNTVKSHFQSLASTLLNQNISFDCGCKKTYYAYVYPTRPYEIHLCKAFWTAPVTGTDSKAGTIIHETSHFNVVAGTDDWTYGQSSCKSLAISSPDKAIDNADSHEYYAENTPAQ